MSVAADQGKIETGFEGPGALAGFEYFYKNVDIEALAKKCAETSIKFLFAKEQKRQMVGEFRCFQRVVGFK